MSGPYGSAAADYVDHRIAVFPTRTDDPKKPAVLRPKAFGLRASLDLVSKFPDANIGFMCGTKNGITIVDVDVAGDAALDDALAAYGETPILVRTASGKSHAWFRHNGERRKIRPVENIDILGENGLVVAPPSEAKGKGRYRFMRGSLDDLERLPTIRRGSLPDSVYGSGRTLKKAKSAVANKRRQDMVDGDGRNRRLFNHVRLRALSPCIEDELIAYAFELNSQFAEPMEDNEALRIAKSVWDYKVTDRLIAPGERAVVLHERELESLRTDSDCFILWSDIKFNHLGREGEFALSAKAMSLRFGWDVRRFRRARERLEAKHGRIEQTHEGGDGPHDPHRYAIRARSK